MEGGREDVLKRGEPLPWPGLVWIGPMAPLSVSFTWVSAFVLLVVCLLFRSTRLIQSRKELSSGLSCINDLDSPLSHQEPALRLGLFYGIYKSMSTVFRYSA